MKQFENQIALVTGGSRGIGRAICERLAQHGATVIVNYAQSAAKAEEVVAGIMRQSGKAVAMGFDVASAEATEKAIKEILERHGKIDILVNNAGIAVDALVVRTKTEDWQRTIDVNLSGCFYCARAVAKPMMKARRGRIVNISSVIGLMGNAGQIAYATSKAGIFGLTKSLAKELGSRGVTVNAVAPGYIDTDMTNTLTEELKNSILENVPLSRMGTGEDIAGAVQFLCGEDASYITGSVISVNGGMYM